MPEKLFEISPRPVVAINGEVRVFPINRIFCVGQNYAAHAAEMGSTADYEAPFYFTKSPAAVEVSGATIAYPQGTSNYHFEMEFAVYLGSGGKDIARDSAMDAVYGFGCALDMTRRDLQVAAKDKKRPWDVSKDFEQAAVLAPITIKSDFGRINRQRISLSVNGAVRQDSTLDDLIHDVPAIIADLSTFYHLTAGDVILTGTPAGVGPVVAGDKIRGSVSGLSDIALDIAE